MRLSMAILLTLFLASCGPMHPFWRPWTPEEREAERKKETERYIALRAISEKADERRQQRDSIVQAFSLSDVEGCTRLGLIRYESLDSARDSALDAGGDTILAQRRKYTTSKYISSRKRTAERRDYNRDDYEVYQCHTERTRR
jgi:hypothetical protein